MDNETETETPAPVPIDLARAMVDHPGHEGCCPVCRRAVAEAWANSIRAGELFTQIEAAVGRMMSGGGLSLGSLFGGGRRRRRKGEEGEPEANGELSDEALGIEDARGPGPHFAGEPFPPPIATPHAHPGLAEADDVLHAHLGGDEPHTHAGPALIEREVE